MSKTTDVVIDYLNDHKTLSDHPVLQAAIDRYGSMNQINMMIEELLECATALHNIRRMSNNQLREGYVNICDEIADVIIMMEQGKKIFDSTTINERVSFKMDRLELRIESQVLTDGEITSGNDWKEVDELLAKMSGGIVKGAKPPPVEQDQIAMPVDMAQLGWIHVNHHLPDDNQSVDVLIETGKEVKDVMYWSKQEGFNATAETVAHKVDYWRPMDYLLNKINEAHISENFAQNKEIHAKCRKNRNGTWHCIHTMTNCPTKPDNNIPIDEHSINN